MASCLTILCVAGSVSLSPLQAHAALQCHQVWNSPADKTLAEFVQTMKLVKAKPPLVPRHALIDLHKLNVSGENHEAFYKAYYQGHKVAVKWLKADDPGTSFYLDTLYWEFSMLKILESMKVGPKVYGIVVENGKPAALVMEYVEGNFQNWAQHSKYLNESLSKQIMTVFHRLDELEITPMDLQYIVTNDGRLVVIDPGLFFFRSADAPDFPLKAYRKNLGLHKR